MREGRQAEEMRHWQAQTASFWEEEAYGMPEGTKDKGKWGKSDTTRVANGRDMFGC